MQRSISKAHLRKKTLEVRREMAFEDVFVLSSRVQSRFTASAIFRCSKRLALYSSFQNEVLTDEVFLLALKEGKEVYYPKVLPRALSAAPGLGFFKVEDLKDLTPGSHEIPEPGGNGGRVGPEVFDLVVVPGVAFDMSGARVGYGKGYYDRALKGLGCPIVALAYEFQLTHGAIPVRGHDVRVTAIVTEKRIIEV